MNYWHWLAVPANKNLPYGSLGPEAVVNYGLWPMAHTCCTYMTLSRV